MSGLSRLGYSLLAAAGGQHERGLAVVVLLVHVRSLEHEVFAQVRVPRRRGL